MKALNLTIALLLSLPVTSAAQTTALTAAFDWRVPDRFTPDGMAGVRLPFAGLGKVESQANLRTLNPERAFGTTAPAGWPAIFEACGSRGPITSYIWSVDGVPAAESKKCKATTIRFPREGRYRVELTVVASSGARASAAQDVNIQDWLIIGFGDSYASGEGVPNVAVTPQRYVDFDAAYALVSEARERFEQLQAEVAVARAAVDAARADLIAARTDLDHLEAAFQAFLRALENLALAQVALTNAIIAHEAAKLRVVEATALVVFECAQFWDPAGCTAAKAALKAAQTAEAKARAAKTLAERRRTEAAEAAARAALTVPVGGFEDALEILAARVNLILARINTLETAFQSVKNLAALAGKAYDLAQAALLRRSGEIVALWQDSVKVKGAVINPLPPFYRPNPYSQCHQSKFAGQALAALALEQADPKTSVTFIHLACTGATVKEGLLGKYAGVDPRPDPIVERGSQVAKAATLTEGREVDAFVVSIGGNDVHFADIITKCVGAEPCFTTADVETLPDATIARTCDPSGIWSGLLGFSPGSACRGWLNEATTVTVGSRSAAELFEDGLATLPEKYAAVQAAIASSWPGLPTDRMFITPYPNITRDQDGNTCGFDPTKSLPGISPAEYLWAEQVVTRRLNDTIVQQAGLLGWTVVNGIETSFARHGYCSDQSWVVAIDQSFTRQAGYMGIAHPNADGHQAYAQRIRQTLQAAFYPHAAAGSLGSARVDGRP